MSIELDVSSAFDLEGWLSSEKAGDLQRELEERIIRLLFSNELDDFQFRKLAMQLAWIGAEPQNKELLAKEIVQLCSSSEGGFTPCGSTGLKKLWEGTCELTSKTVNFVKEHKTEILIGAALVATGAGLAVVTGYSVSVAVGGVVVYGVGSILASDDPPNPNIPQHLPYPSKSEIEILQQSVFHIDLEIPQSPNEFLVTSKGVWANGQFYPTDPLMKNSLLASSLDPSFGQRTPLDAFSTQKKFLSPETLAVLEGAIGENRSFYGSPLFYEEGAQLKKEASSWATPYEPIPPQPGSSLIRGFFETVGREVLGPEVVVGTTASQLQKSHLFTTGGERSSSLGIGGINGMNTSLDYAVGHANYLAKFTDGLSIDWIYNNSHGVLGDGLEIFTQNYFGVSINTAELLTNNWVAFHEENKHNPKAKYLQFCHSQGAIHVKNALLRAPKEIRARVIVVAIAPGAVVPKKLCFASYNYASKKDIVPFGELVFTRLLDTNEERMAPSTEMALQHLEELIWLDPHPNATGIDHDFRSPTFFAVIESRLKKHLKNNGNYE